MNTMTCSLKSINPLASYPSQQQKMKSPSFRQKLTFPFQPPRSYMDGALSFSSKFRFLEGLHFWPGGKRLVKVVALDLLDPGEILNGSSKMKNKLCLFGWSHCLLVYDCPTQIKEDGDSYTSQGSQPTEGRACSQTHSCGLRLFWDVGHN